MTKVNLKNILTAVRDIINRSSETALRKAQSAEKQAGAAQATANTAKTTADNAQTAAENVQTVADNAKITADNAKITADNAKTAADNAKTTAKTAKTAAENAQTVADSAQTAADNAKTAADAAQTKVAKALTVSSTGGISAPTDAMGYGTYQTLHLNSKDTYHPSSFGVTESTGLQISVGRDGGIGSSATASNPSTLEFKANGSTCMRLKGIDELIINSSTSNSTKKFKITVDDSGTLSATEVTA